LADRRANSDHSADRAVLASLGDSNNATSCAHIRPAARLKGVT
jgi:hypothetical protein